MSNIEQEDTDGIQEVWMCPRLDAGNDRIGRLEKLKSFLSHYDKYYVYEEVAKETKKLHWHVSVLLESEKEIKAFQTRWNSSQWFKGLPASERSCSKDRTGNYHVYVTKGGNRICDHGFSDEELKAIEDQSYEPQNAKKRETLTQRLLTDFNNQNLGLLIYDNKIEMYRKISEFVLGRWKDEPTICQPFYPKVVAGIVQTIIIKNSDRILVDDGNDRTTIFTTMLETVMTQFGL